MVTVYTCIECGKTFELKHRRNAKFCSDVCRVKDFNNKHPNYWKKYRVIEDRDKQNKKYRDNYREHTLVTIVNGKRTTFRYINKLPRPEDDCCQICGKKTKVLAYHHWDEIIPNQKLVLGLWVCQNHCHNVIEAFEKGILNNIIEKYLMLKQEVEKLKTEEIKK